jgi:hypothetical protein
MKAVVRTLAIGLLFSAGTASAEGDAAKSRYSLFKPVPQAMMRELNTDRPDKTESPYTVDAGHFQIEADLVTYTRDRDEASGVKSESTNFMVSNLKVGLTSSLDLQLVLSPHERQTFTVGAAKVQQNGFGDTVARLKWNLLGNDGGDVAIGVMPFVKFATASSRLADKNESVEGGLIVPFAISLPHDIGLGMMFQVNRARNENGGGNHAEFISSVTASHDLVGELAGYAEFYSESSPKKALSGWRRPTPASPTASPPTCSSISART